MPYVEGETLRDKLDRETQLGIDEAVGITTDVAGALDYAHQQGVIRYRFRFAGSRSGCNGIVSVIHAVGHPLTH